MNIWWNELIRGKSYGRAKLNELLAETLKGYDGKWLDLGAGAGGSYVRFLPGSIERVATDLEPHPGVLALDADKHFPFVDGSFDGCLALNMLYVTVLPEVTLKEIIRVLRPGGKLIATFPFFFAENPEPHDYHRWTREGVEKLLSGLGMTQCAVKPVGGAGTVFGTTMLPLRGSWIIKLIAAPFVAAADGLDRREKITYLWLVIAVKP